VTYTHVYGVNTYGQQWLLCQFQVLLLSALADVFITPVHVSGFIATKLTEGYGATKSPDEGTVSIRHGLFGAAVSGWYYGSDAVRSPLHFIRNPGEPAYDGAVPF
jgi:hypothetical protein